MGKGEIRQSVYMAGLFAFVMGRPQQAVYSLEYAADLAAQYGLTRIADAIRQAIAAGVTRSAYWALVDRLGRGSMFKAVDYADARAAAREAARAGDWRQASFFAREAAFIAEGMGRPDTTAAAVALAIEEVAAADGVDDLVVLGGLDGVLE